MLVVLYSFYYFIICTLYSFDQNHCENHLVRIVIKVVSNRCKSLFETVEIVKQVPVESTTILFTY